LNLDTFKLAVAVLIIVIGVGAFYYFDEQSDLVRVPGLMAAAALAIVVALQTDLGRRARDFAKGSLRELRQVIWPTRKETAQVTLIVVALVITVALFLWVVDLGLQKAMKFLIGQVS
jgi:preprotein translocase subunit SecE